MRERDTQPPPAHNEPVSLSEDISLIIPLYNEESEVPSLLDRCLRMFRDLTDKYEIICVEDGSTDRTLEILKSYHGRDQRIKILVLSRNFGHQAAFTAGLSVARGKFIVMMDGDLQDPPELIPRMHEKMLENNCDVVYGKRIQYEESWFMGLGRRLFHRVFRRLSQLHGADDVGNFSVFNRKVLNALMLLTEKHRYLPGLRSFVGFRQEYVEYKRPARASGQSKMTLPKLSRLAFDAIFSFSDIPIKICIYVGIIGVVVSCGGIVYMVISKIAGIAPLGWLSLILSVFFWGSIQLIFLGIFGEYLFRIYRETQNRPLFIIQEFFD